MKVIDWSYRNLDYEMGVAQFHAKRRNVEVPVPDNYSLPFRV